MSIARYRGELQLGRMASGRVVSGVYRTGMSLPRATITSPKMSRINSALLRSPSSLIRPFQMTQLRQLHSAPVIHDKHKLLSQATGPISRLLIHIKWPLKRSNKPFSIDDISAFFSWLVMGNVLWIILGTTTFGLVSLYSLYTSEKLLNGILCYFMGDDSEKEHDDTTKVRDNGIVAYITSSILSFGLGLEINFYKGNVLPQFKDGKLIFKNIQIVSVADDENDMSFSFNIQTLNLSLSFGKWYDGHGLINDLEIFGLTGKVNRAGLPSIITDDPSPVVFRRFYDNIHSQYDMNGQTDIINEPLLKQRSRMDASYQLNQVKIHDSYFEIIENGRNTPLKISLINCELPKLTGKTLIIDFFNAENVTGLINDSMFTIHKKNEYNTTSNDTVRFKLNGIDMGNLTTYNPNLRFNWILNGKAEIIADIRIPNSDESETMFNFDYKDSRISNLITGLIKDIAHITTNDEDSNPSHVNDNQLMNGALQAVYQTFDTSNSYQAPREKPSSEYVIVNVTVKFYNLKASLPKALPLAYSNSIPFITLHDLRSLISYINKLDTDNLPPIIVKTTAIEKLSDLYNLENLSHTKLFDLIISDIYEDLLRKVSLDQKRIINEKSNLWSHSLASQLLLLGLGVIV